jgi:WD40 repeat protein
MQICQNPSCSIPFNPVGNKFCTSCGSTDLGQLFKGRYRIIRLLGAGGFGKTYEAQDVDRLDASCVIKQFVPQVQGTGAFAKAAEMFKEEAKRLFELGENHPQIPRLVSYFEQGSNLYLVQEFIPGDTLLQELKLRTFDEAGIRELLADLLPILVFIHDRNVIHRDIKPENIIRRSSDRKLVLIDFGGAKQVTQTTLGRQGTGIFTLGYAPLEQMQGYACAASDLYALGATCVRLLTRDLPLHDNYGNLIDPLYDVINARWLWRERAKEKDLQVSDQLSNVFDKLLRHFAKERYQSAQNVLEDLQGNSVGVAKPQQHTPQHTPTLDWKNTSFAYSLVGHTNLVRSVVFSRDGQTLISSSNDKTIRFWNLQTRKLQSRLTENGDWVVIANAPDGQMVASGSSDCTVKVWDLSTGRPQYVLRGHFDLINALCFTEDRKLLVSASRDRTIRIWQLQTGELKQILAGHAGLVYSVAISADGKFLVSGASDKTIKIWRMDTGEELQTLPGSLGFIRAVAVNSSGIIASGGFGNIINLWDLATGKHLQRLEGHNGFVESLAMSPDGQTLISGSSDRTVKIWNLQTGALISTLTGHSGSVLSIDITRDGRTIATAGEDKIIRIWEVKG